MWQIQKYLKQHLSLLDEKPLIDIFSVVKILKKGEKLVVPGQRTAFLAFINKGAFRVYFINRDGNEITTWFSFSEMFITDLPSYYSDSLATQYIEAIEDSELVIAQKSHLEQLYLARPEYNQFGRQFAEKGMVKVMQRMMSLQTKSAEERYMELLTQPKFMKIIPLKYMATYLGITDTSLSRIRRNIH